VVGNLLSNARAHTPAGTPVTVRALASGGSGLGLSIVAAIAEAHGGRASVETAPGRGATLRVCLPLAGAPANGAAPDPEG